MKLNPCEVSVPLKSGPLLVAVFKAMMVFLAFTVLPLLLKMPPPLLRAELPEMVLLVMFAVVLKL